MIKHGTTRKNRRDKIVLKHFSTHNIKKSMTFFLGIASRRNCRFLIISSNRNWQSAFMCHKCKDVWNYFLFMIFSGICLRSNGADQDSNAGPRGWQNRSHPNRQKHQGQSWFHRPHARSRPHHLQRSPCFWHLLFFLRNICQVKFF